MKKESVLLCGRKKSSAVSAAESPLSCCTEIDQELLKRREWQS